MTNEPTFYDRFRANMELLGLPAPRSAFGTASLATANIAALARAIQQYPQRVTLVEIWRTIPVFASAAVMGELTVIVAGGLAALYLGACIGSLLVATGQTVSAETLARAAAGMPRSVWMQLPHIRVQMQMAGRGQR
jgi:hypothetical protein